MVEASSLTPRLRWARERELLKTDPVLAKLLRAEAITAGTLDEDLSDEMNLRNALDVFCYALDDHANKHGADMTLDVLNAVVRRAIVAVTAAPFSNNPLFPKTGDEKK